MNFSPWWGYGYFLEPHIVNCLLKFKLSIFYMSPWLGKLGGHSPLLMALSKLSYLNYLNCKKRTHLEGYCHTEIAKFHSAYFHVISPNATKYTTWLDKKIL